MRNKKIFDISITRKHIGAARRQNARKCAIAMAIVESDPDIAWANVTRYYTKFARFSNDRVTVYITPKDARDFITDFDNGRAPKPFQLVVTRDAFVSERPRQMRQRDTAVKVEQRRSIAKATGRKLRDVPAEEAQPFDSSGWATTKTARERVVRKPKETPRPYAHRETLAEALQRQGITKVARRRSSNV